MDVDSADMLSGESLSERVYDRIRWLLTTLEIVPGSRMGIDSLARNLRVSQTPVREALHRLAAEGLVKRINNIGFCATSVLSPTQIKDLFEVRLALDTIAARHAANNIRPSELAELRYVMKQIETFCSGGQPLRYGDFIQIDLAFNTILTSASNNSVMADMLAQVRSHFHLLAHLFEAPLPSEVSLEMRRIFEAVLAGDSEAAAQAMHDHIERSTSRFVNFLDTIA